MLRRNKTIAIVMAFVFCMSFLSPAFIAPDQAAAASTYTVIRTETISTVNTYLTTPKVAIEIPDVAAYKAGDLVTVHLPSDLKLDNVGGAVGTEFNDPKVTFTSNGTEVAANLFGAAPPAGVPVWVNNVKANVKVDAPAFLPDGTTTNAFRTAGSYAAYPIGDSAIEIKCGAALPVSGKGLLYIELTNVKVTSTFDGDIKANFVAPSNSGFSSNVATIAKYVSGGKGTSTIMKSVTTMGNETKTMDTIMIQETVKNSIANGEVIKLKLPSGYKWNIGAATATGSWAFTGLVFTLATAESDRTLTVTAPAAGLGALGSEGRIYVNNARIVVDDSSAKIGEVKFNISSNIGNVTDQDVLIANYADYSVTVEAVKTTEVVAGRDDTELGDIKIKEGIAGSILPNRTITLTVPSGVKWNTDGGAGSVWPQINGINPFSFEPETGDINLAALGGMPTSVSNNGRTLKLTLGAGPYTKSAFLLKKLKVSVAPDFAGDLEIEVAGTAGVSGNVKVATVKPVVEMTNDGSAKIIIGAQNQTAGDIIIKESKKEAIKADAVTPHLVLALPDGAEWATTPKVEVTEGDISIDKVSKAGQNLTINFKSSSTKPSTIKVSDVKVTSNRNIPEGDFKVRIVRGSNAVTDNAAVTRFDVSTIVSTVIGKCITPAPGEGTSGSATGQFRIDSNIYQVNGVSKVMDAAPYIKDGRTYVPVRYMGYALGLADADVVWDAATQKVTLTKDSNVVELTVGSTTYTVNGESKTMDVAPEITNDRTMLPARYVAEGLGAVVGWDAATRTVLISK